MIQVTQAEGIREDSSYAYFDMVRGYIASGDGSASFSFHKTPEHLIVHIRPSSSDFKQDIINNLLSVHRLLGMKAIFSKSLALSKTISYTIDLKL